MEELMDVLDENGNKTGEILTREQIHKKGLCHRIVVIAIIDAQRNILMQQRSKNKAKNPEKWDVAAAGHVSSGQTSIEAAMRETLEEVGIKVNEEELEYVLTYKNKENVEEDYIDNQIYDCYIVKRDKINLRNIKVQESEVEQVKLCNLKEFNQIIENGNIMERDELYKKIIEYLK
ncbi:MAG: NUDIX domain-containing protein [Clostridia bacterium]|nr:NUDIX domain-containing protein [Clostridia bacterium]